MSNLADLETIPPFDSIPGSVRIRRVEGERQTLAVVELAPGAIVPEHRHPQEQLGICITGRLTITVDGESREFGPGGTWRVFSDRPHIAAAGPEGAVLIEAFAPTRDDWDFPLLEPRPPVWPGR
jgi:quercetin dioxygenase-like cupin family protein